MKQEIYSMLKERIIFFLKTIYYGFFSALLISPIFAAITYYPEIAIPFGCGVLTGIFCNKKRRDSIIKGVKRLISLVIDDLGLAF